MASRILSFGPALTRKREPRRATPLSSRSSDREDAGPLDREDAERFRRLVLPHLDTAYNFARYLCRDAADAEDLTQDAMIRAMRGFRGFRGGDPRAWLLAIVRSRFQTWVRRRRDHATSEALEGLASEADTPEAAAVRRGETQAVRRAIGALPEPFREAIVLREIEDLSYREIAEITAAPIGTVMSRLARGRQMLLAAFTPAAEETP
jgi:RNA polymerase sigma-70 factor (ECF subfamily)